MVTNKTIQTEMLEHSQAKVELYSTYLTNYLAVLTNSKFIKTVNIFDLFCGEGLYEDNNEGSPLAGLSKATEVLQKGIKFNPTINFYFNDNGESVIEPGISKIERLKKIISLQNYDSRIQTHYSKKNFSSALARSYEIIKTKDDPKSLYFIDPYGYKDVPPDCIKETLSHKGTELLLFVPASPMYRFSKGTKNPLRGHEALHNFLTLLFPNGYHPTTTIDTFIQQCKENFRKYLGPKYYVDTFTLQRDKKNKYCLFFFTTHDLGFEKMLEAKWKMDETFGEGFRIGGQGVLPGMDKTSAYPKLLETAILEKEGMTNGELYYFGLNQGYLPKHTRKALDSLRTQKKLSCESLDGKPVRGYYINYKNASDSPERRVLIRITDELKV